MKSIHNESVKGERTILGICLRLDRSSTRIIRPNVETGVSSVSRRYEGNAKKYQKATFQPKYQRLSKAQL